MSKQFQNMLKNLLLAFIFVGAVIFFVFFIPYYVPEKLFGEFSAVLLLYGVLPLLSLVGIVLSLLVTKFASKKIFCSENANPNLTQMILFVCVIGIAIILLSIQQESSAIDKRDAESLERYNQMLQNRQR